MIDTCDWMEEETEDEYKIDPNKKIKEPLTYQDPCNASRNGGLWEEARQIIP